MYSFGLGGNGQLGTHSTCNRKSPAPIKGPFMFSSAPMDKGTSHYVVFLKWVQKLNCCIDISCEFIFNKKFTFSFAGFEQLCRIKKIYAGGDQSFAHFTANVGSIVTSVCQCGFFQEKELMDCNHKTSCTSKQFGSFELCRHFRTQTRMWKYGTPRERFAP